MTLNISILKIILSFKTWQTHYICNDYHRYSERKKNRKTPVMKDKHKNKNILKDHKDSMKGEM